MFSVAFSKLGEGESNNPTNNVPLKFGPVTQTGGHRRLNVAVTRAKREMIVFCSFDPNDMKIRPTSPHEAILLQKFLALAKNPERSGDIAIRVPRSFHIEELAQSIKEMGYRVQTQLGLSELRVDVAVGQPGEDHWEVAVMVDGPGWSNRGSAEQRELLPLAVLGSRGWKRVMRVWLPSWIHEREAVLEEIRDAMDGTGEEPPPDEPPDEPVPEPSPAVVDGGHETEFTSFVPRILHDREHLDSLAAPERWAPNYLREVEEAVVSTINLVLEAEAPIESHRLARLVLNCWGFQQVRQNRIDSILKFIPRNHLTRTPFGDYVWSTPSQAQSWTEYRHSGPTAERQPHEIAPKEFTNALVDLVEHHRSVSKEDATRALASIFGFDRLTKKVRGHIEAIIDYAIQTGVLSIDTDARLRVTSISSPDGETQAPGPRLRGSQGRTPAGRASKNG
jgi:very-short-patch-repair endonuclease